MMKPLTTDKSVGPMVTRAGGELPAGRLNGAERFMAVFLTFYSQPSQRTAAASYRAACRVWRDSAGVRPPLTLRGLRRRLRAVRGRFEALRARREATDGVLA